MPDHVTLFVHFENTVLMHRLSLLVVALLAASATAELAIRKPAPEWSGKAVLNDAIIDLSSASLKGKWVVLFFYPLDFTFVCPTEIVEFNNKWVPRDPAVMPFPLQRAGVCAFCEELTPCHRYAEFKKLGAEVVGVSVDSPHSHLAW